MKTHVKFETDNFQRDKIVNQSDIFEKSGVFIASITSQITFVRIKLVNISAT